MKTTHITIDAGAVSPAKAIAAAARGPSLLIVSARAFDELTTELGGIEAATEHLLRVATKTNRPIAVNFPTAEGESSTACIAPKGWTPERLRGWLGGKREGIEGLFGTATVRET
jgi:hypothetical protein